jgi:hypothetical protein
MQREARRFKTSAPAADNKSHMMDHELARVREWAQGRLDAMEEAPWASHRYQHMITVIDEMLGRRSPPVLPQTPKVVHLNSYRRRQSPRYCRSSR